MSEDVDNFKMLFVIYLIFLALFFFGTIVHNAMLEDSLGEKYFVFNVNFQKNTNFGT